jgi:hypothetical protein
MILTRIAVIDGQGASIGSAIIKKIRQAYGDEADVWALGTNAIATTQMMKAGANRGATGESAVCHCVQEVDVVIGSISILVCNSLMGELTWSMAHAISSSRAAKLLLPITQDNVIVVSTALEPLPHLIDKLIREHLAPFLGGKEPSRQQFPQSPKRGFGSGFKI